MRADAYPARINLVAGGGGKVTDESLILSFGLHFYGREKGGGVAGNEMLDTW